MTEHDLPDLPPDVAALLADARGTPSAPPAERRRVAGRLALTLGMAIPAASLAGARVVGHASIAKALGLAALVALAGGAVRLATHRVPAPVARSAAPRRETSRAAPPASVSAPAVVTMAPVPATAVVSAAPAAPAVPAAPRVDEDRAFQAELSLLDRAVVALGRDDASGAGAALSEHARRLPRGRLTPEREALRVRCTAAGADPAAAEEARRRFHRRFPRSVLGAAVDRAVEGASPGR